MSTLAWIVVAGFAMSAIALVGGITTVLSARALERLILPLVAFAAGSLLGGAFFHMLPSAIAHAPAGSLSPFAWLSVGFVAFFVLEQFLHWHHCRRGEGAASCPHEAKPLSLLVLVADGIHNFIGGLAVGGAFVIDVRLGWTAWLVAASHEVPQELGDFGVLVHGGLSTGKALVYNTISALTFVVGGVVAWAVSKELDVSFLLALAAGNFIYIAASDLVPEVNQHRRVSLDIVHFLAFALGMALMMGVRVLFEG